MNYIIKRYHSIITAVIIVLCCGVYGISVLKENSLRDGKCGENLTWSLDDQTLSIEGSGEMYDYSSPDDVPWSSNLTYIQIIKMHDGVESVGSYTCFNCTKLRMMMFASDIITLGEHSFEKCIRLSALYLLAPMKYIKASAFQDCVKLKSVTLPGTLLSVHFSAFFFCPLLESITVDENNNNYKSIDGVLFTRQNNSIAIYPPNKNVTGYAIPDGIISIEQYAFNNCSKLETLFIPDGVTSIEQYAFYNSSYLTTVIIPDSVKSIDNNAFDSCKNLKRVYYQGSGPVSGDSAFDDKTDDLVICVSSNYAGTSFCGKPITTDDSLCPKGPISLNKCYETVFENDHFVVKKKRDAIEFENRTNQCVEYHCYNDTGFISWSLCNRTDEDNLICFDDKCVDNKTLTNNNKARVEFDLEEGIIISELNADEMLGIICQAAGLSTENVNVAYEVNKEGNVVRIILYVENEETANIVARLIDNNQTCEFGVICRHKAVRVISLSQQFVSSAQDVDGMIIYIVLFIVSFYTMML